MAEPPRPKCPSCGVFNDDDAIFCGGCGRELTRPQPTEPVRRGSSSAKPGTVLGLPAVRPPGSSDPEASPTSSSGPNPTLMSKTPLRNVSVPPEGGDRPAPSDEEVGPPDAPTLLDGPAFSLEEMQRAADPPLSNEARALLDRFAGGGGQEGADRADETPAEAPARPVTSVGDQQQQTPPAEPREQQRRRDEARAVAEAKAQVPDSQQTMLGMPVPSGIKREPQKEEKKPSQPESKRPVPEEKKPSQPESKRQVPNDGGATMLGIPTPVTRPMKKPPGSARRAQTRGDEGGMTMLGLPSVARTKSEPAKDAPPEPAPPQDIPAPRGIDGFDDDDEDLEPSGGGRRWLVAVVLLGVLALGVAVVGAVTLLGGEPYEVATDVVVGGDRVRLTLAITPPPEGGQVRLAGREQPIEDGEATFDVEANALSVGTNELPLEVVDADGSVWSTRLIFDISYRAVADLGGLRSEPPSYAVRFQVMEGARLQVTGHPVELDAEGRYTKTVPLDEALAGAVDAGDAVVHHVPFTVEVPGMPPISERIDTAIPRTPLRVVAPAEDLVVEADSVICVGTTDPSAEVQVNGVEVELEEGRFTHQLELGSVGEHPVEVVAESPGKVPQKERRVVRRVRSLTPLIRDFSKQVDSGLDWQTLSRDPASLRDRRVRFRGEVVALERELGQTLMQLFVTEGCPEGRRCSLHVTYQGGAEVEPFSVVTVYGSVIGQWEGQTQSGAELRMPSIRARFVVVERRRRRRSSLGRGPLRLVRTRAPGRPGAA